MNTSHEHLNTHTTDLTNTLSFIQVEENGMRLRDLLYFCMYERLCAITQHEK